jgi:hypothetical protein
MTVSLLKAPQRIGLAAVILISPLSCYVQIGSSPEPGFAAKIPPAEPLLWVLFLLWVVSRRSDVAPIVPVPAPFIGFVAAVGVSAIATTPSPLLPLSSIKELLQAVDYYVLFLLLLLNNFSGRNGLNLMFRLVLYQSWIVVTLGVLQRLHRPEATFLVSSLFDNRNVLSAYLAVVLPLLFGVLAFENRASRQVVLALPIIAGVLLCSAPAALLIAFTAILLLSLAISRRRRTLYMVTLSLAVAV